MIELETPQIEPVEEAGTYAKYEAGPLQAGYGVTLGNALRRVLLSSLEGAAVTSIQIRDIYQEFSTIPGVKEDVTQIVLNVKKLRLKSYAAHPVQLRLIKSGAGAVTAADIAESADVEIVNPELVLMTLDTDDVTIEMDLTVERGVGYLGAERAEALPIGVIAVDAIFTPVRKINYWVESMRVGQMTNYDKLTIEIETDGTIAPEEALSRSAEILVNQFRPFVTVGMAAIPAAAVTGAAALPSNAVLSSDGVNLAGSTIVVVAFMPIRPSAASTRSSAKRGSESFVNGAQGVDTSRSVVVCADSTREVAAAIDSNARSPEVEWRCMGKISFPKTSPVRAWLQRDTRWCRLTLLNAEWPELRVPSAISNQQSAISASVCDQFPEGQ